MNLSNFYFSAQEWPNYWFQSLSAFQSQLSHGFPYSDRRGDYGGNIPGATGPGTRLTHDHDPLSLHQALQSAVDDGQGAVIDENVAFMSDLPLLKSKLHFYPLSRVFLHREIWDAN